MQSDIQGIRPISAMQTLEGRVTDELRRLIIEGSIPQGARLVQRQVAQELRVSPTPIRSAWVLLASEHLITIDTNGHGHVTRLTREDFQEAYAARLGVEGLAARLGAEAITPDAVEVMQELLQELEHLAQRRDRGSYLRVRWDFHETVYRSAQRERLLQEVQRLYWRSERYLHLLLEDESRFEDSLRHYRNLLSACTRNDGDDAEKVIAQSIRWGLRALEGQLPREAEEESAGSSE